MAVTIVFGGSLAYLDFCVYCRLEYRWDISMVEKTEWEKPEVKDLGKAEDLIKNVAVLGGGDTLVVGIDPS